MPNPAPSARLRLSRLLSAAAVAGLLGSLWACSTTPVLEPRDGAPDRPVDVSAIPDPVPRAEPPSRYGNPPHYTVMGRRYVTLQESRGYVERGIASWYGTKFHGRRTSSGEPYDMYAMTAAHKTLPLPTYVQVTNLRNGRSVVVRVNDRGPFVKNRLIDLSYAAAVKLGVAATGTAPVEVRAIDPGAPAPLPQAAAAEPARGARIYLQVGAFAHRGNAERLREQLLRIPVEPVEIQEAVAREQAVYRVRIGPLRDAEQADRMTDRLAQAGHPGVHVVVD